MRSFNNSSSEEYSIWCHSFSGYKQRISETKKFRVIRVYIFQHVAKKIIGKFQFFSGCQTWKWPNFKKCLRCHGKSCRPLHSSVRKGRCSRWFVGTHPTDMVPHRPDQGQRKWFPDVSNVSIHTVDGQNPAPPRMILSPLFIGLENHPRCLFGISEPSTVWNTEIDVQRVEVVLTGNMGWSYFLSWLFLYIQRRNFLNNDGMTILLQVKGSHKHTLDRHVALDFFK